MHENKILWVKIEGRPLWLSRLMSYLSFSSAIFILVFIGYRLGSGQSSSSPHSMVELLDAILIIFLYDFLVVFTGYRLEFWAIILITVGAIALVIIVSVLGCQASLSYRRRKKAASYQSSSLQEDSGASYPQYIRQEHQYWRGPGYRQPNYSGRIWRQVSDSASNEGWSWDATSGRNAQTSTLITRPQDYVTSSDNYFEADVSICDITSFHFP